MRNRSRRASNVSVFDSERTVCGSYLSLFLLPSRRSRPYGRCWLVAFQSNTVMGPWCVPESAARRMYDLAGRASRWLLHVSFTEQFRLRCTPSIQPPMSQRALLHVDNDPTPLGSVPLPTFIDIKLSHGLSAELQRVHVALCQGPSTRPLQP